MGDEPVVLKIRQRNNMLPDFISHCSILERDLYFLSLSEMGALADGQISLPGKHCVVFLACNAIGVSVDIISDMAESLLLNGAVYFCCYGPDCERVHDIIDEVIVASYSDDGSVIMTTWHSDETLLEALYFFMANAIPDFKYVGTCNSGVAISIDNHEWDIRIRANLGEPDMLFEKWENDSQ